MQIRGVIIDSSLYPAIALLAAAAVEQLVDGTGLGGQDIEVVDLDGDGDQDIVASFRDSQAIFGYLNDGTGATFEKINIGAPTTIVPGQFVIKDIDADGDLDVAAIELYDSFLGEASTSRVVLHMQPPDPRTTWERVDVTSGQLWGLRAIDAGDLNGDGQLDIVVGATEVTDSSGATQGNGVY